MSVLLIQEEFVAYMPSLARVVGGISEAVTLQAIWFKADKKTGELVMPRAELAQYLGISPSSLGRYLKVLAALGVLSFEGRTRSGYDKTTKYTVHPAVLDSLVQDAATPVSAPVKDAVTGTAESSGSQAGNMQDAPTRMGGPVKDAATGPQTVRLTHSESVNLTHSSTKNEKNNPPTPQRSSFTDDQGFGEFWGKYPATEWKAKTNKTGLRGIWFSLTDEQRSDTLVALDAYLGSELWLEASAIPGPKMWLENEPWLEVAYGNLPKPKPDTRIKWTDPATYRLED